MFVSFADAVSAHSSAAPIVLAERGIYAVVDGPEDAIAVVRSSLDAGARTSTTTDDIAEVIDGFHEELRVRATPVSFALVVVEDDALAFFGAGTCVAQVVGGGWSRRVISGDLGIETVRFFRAYVRRGDRAFLVSNRAYVWRAPTATSKTPPASAGEARSIISGLDAAVVVINVDEEPRIRS